MPYVSDLQRLQGAAQLRCTQAYRPGTQANRVSHVILFIAFTMHFQISDFPATVPALLLFGEFLLRGFQTGKSVTNALSSLDTFHTIHGMDASSFHHYRVLLFRRALPLTVRRAPHRAPALPFEVLEQLCLFMKQQGDHGTVFAALLACTFFAMARLSTLAPPTNLGYDSTRYPTLRDIRNLPDRSLLRIKWAKAHQAPGDAYWVPLLPAGSSPACPVGNLAEARARLPHRKPSAPLFGVGGKESFFFTLRTARQWLKLGLAAVGRPADEFSFHSLRRGACTLAFTQGADISDIKNLGGWRSDAVQCYIPTLASRARAAAALIPSFAEH